MKNKTKKQLKKVAKKATKHLRKVFTFLKDRLFNIFSIVISFMEKTIALAIIYALWHIFVEPILIKRFGFDGNIYDLFLSLLNYITKIK